jgi:CHAT domain-containing protein
MKHVILALLLLGAHGCARRAADDDRRLLDTATLAMRRGQLDAAQSLADQALASSGAAPQTIRTWRFTILLSEVLLRKHALPDAHRLLNAEFPAGSTFEPLRARREFLRGWGQLLDGDLKTATTTLERARQLTGPSNDAGLQLDIDVLDGVIQLQLGHRDRGESLLNGVLTTATATGDRYHQAVALLDLGYGQLVQKRYDAALTSLERVLAFTELKDLTVYGDALNNAGICYSRLGQFDRAAAAQRSAVARHEGGARREYEQALGQLGTTYRRAARTQEGVTYLRQAFSVASGAGLTADAALWAGNLADASIDLGDWDEGERFNNEARRLKTAAGSTDVAYNTLRAADIAAHRGKFDEAARLFAEAMASSRDDPSVRWSADEGLAQVAMATRHPDVAARHFESALATIERTRSDLIRTDYKLSYLTRLIEFYRVYVDALVQRGQIGRALEVADSSRGRVLAERQGVTPTLHADVNTFRARAAAAGMVFLSYWLGPTQSYLWIVTPDRVQIVALPPAQEIEALVREHQGAIVNAMADPLKAAAGDRLFQLLVKPALPSIPHGSRILIVPDGALYALNFETLPVAAPGAGQPGSHYWIEDVEIAVAPSLAMLNTSPAATLASSSLLLIGNAAARGPEYPALKYAGAEMANVARHFPAGHVTSYAGEQALPAAYRSARPDRFSNIHFTAHATANLDSPLDSAVILSGPDSAFKLYARDIADAPLQADLVTVSACRSAGERTYSGEGLVGFAWAFLRGGARRVIAGLWDVDDRSTADLMDALYGGLAAGEPAGKALRSAKLALIGRGGSTAQPYYWAAFELLTLSP